MGAINSFYFLPILKQLCEGNADRVFLLNAIMLSLTFESDKKDPITGKREEYGKMADGRRWIWDTAARWQKKYLPLTSEYSTNQHFKWLEKKKIIKRRKDLSLQYFDCKRKPFKANILWLTIDFEVFDKLLEKAHGDYEAGRDSVDTKEFQLARAAKRKYDKAKNDQSLEEQLLAEQEHPAPAPDYPQLAPAFVEASKQSMEISTPVATQNKPVDNAWPVTMDEVRPNTQTPMDTNVGEKPRDYVLENPSQSINPLKKSIKTSFKDFAQFQEIEPGVIPAHWHIYRESLKPKMRKTFYEEVESQNPSFELFWAAYPKRDNKPEAKKAWNTAKKKPAMHQILDGIMFRDGLDKTLNYLKLQGPILRALNFKTFLPELPYAQRYIKNARWDEVIEVAPWLDDVLSKSWAGAFAEPDEELWETLQLKNENELVSLLAYVFTRITQDYSVLVKPAKNMKLVRQTNWLNHGAANEHQANFYNALQGLITDYRIENDYEQYRSPLESLLNQAVQSYQPKRNHGGQLVYGG